MTTTSNYSKAIIFTFSIITLLFTPISAMKELYQRSNQVPQIKNFSVTQNLHNVSFGVDKQENLTERRYAPINHTPGNVLTYHHHHDHNQVTAHILPKTHTRTAHFKLTADDFLPTYQRERGGSFDRQYQNKNTQLQILANQNRNFVDSRQQKDKGLYANHRQMRSGSQER